MLRIGKGEPFRRDWYDFLGDSIFTTDSRQWHDARQLLRPQFLKSRILDLEVFEKHVLTLIEQLPADGAVINLADLFLRYTMDVSTDFLFGKSSGSLTDHEDKFGKAFAEVLRMQNIIARAGYVIAFHLLARDSDCFSQTSQINRSSRQFQTIAQSS